MFHHLLGISSLFFFFCIFPQINNTSTDSMTLKEAKKMIENCKEKLQLVLKRDTVKSNNMDHQQNSYDITNHNKGFLSIYFHTENIFCVLC